MKLLSRLHFEQEKAIGFAAALVLHSVVLYGLWSYHIIPPPSEALTVFVSYIYPAVPAKIIEPVAPKTAPIRQETPQAVAPASPQLLVSSTPVNSPSEPVVPPPQVARVIPAPANFAPATQVVNVLSQIVAAPQTGHQKDELSVSCTERTPPAYPKQSARLGEQGKTVLLVELDAQGRVAHVDIKTSSGFPRLDEAAITAVKTWRCTPAKRNGVAVRSVAMQPFNFIIKGS
jgi:protein TonB